MNRKKRPNYLTVVSGILLAALIALVLNIVIEYHRFSQLQKQYIPEASGVAYTHHCAFITDEYDSVFWDSVYESARAQGTLSHIYVENFGKDLYISYTTDELLKMAIAANVDAIIIKATGEESTRALIDEAAANDIAVSTVDKDDMDSKRFSFTGISNSLMGHEYGRLAMEHCEEAFPTVTLLLDQAESTAEQRLLIAGISQAAKDAGKNIRLETLSLASRNPFDVDEIVQEYVRTHHDTVDVMICTNLEQTQSVSQTAIDLNCVGDFTIIGSYQNHAVLEALKNGVIAANVSVDTEQMGRKAVIGLEEYLTLGHTSDYVSVDVHTIEREDAVQLLADEATTGGEAEHE